MPVNAPSEYFKAEEKFKSAKNKDDKIAALEEMIRLLPRHHGSENMHAQLKARLAKLKKESEKKGARKLGIQKEGEAQVCLIGLTNSGKSFLLSRLTDARPEISDHPYTTTSPVIGMMDYSGVKIQLIEIPATMDSEYLSIARTAELIVLVIRDDKEKRELERILKNSYVKTKRIVVNPWKEDAADVKERIWSALGLIIVYTRKTKTPMALALGSNVRDFAMRIHKDFVENFRFARIWRSDRVMQAGLRYELKNGDIVDIHAE
jgi:ribosome-interacting GTPase 1